MKTVVYGNLPDFKDAHTNVTADKIQSTLALIH